MEPLTLAAAARRLGCSTKHLAKLADQGRIGCYLIGTGKTKERRFTEEAIVEYIAANQIRPTNQSARRGRLPAVPTVV